MNTRILTTLMVIGVIGAVATGSTLAVLNDTEESNTNTFQAGEVDLTVGWDETYSHTNGEVTSDYINGNTTPIFDWSDVKPGDEGEATITLNVEDNPSWLWMRPEMISNDENTVNEPEAGSEFENNDQITTEIDGDGELAQNIRLKLWYDNGAGEDGVRGDNKHNGEEQVFFGGEQVCTNQKLDVVLVLDRSGSIDGPGDEPNSANPQKREAMKGGAKALIDQLDSNDRVSTVSFASEAEENTDLTQSKDDAKTAIDGLFMKGGTNIEAGINTAIDEFNENERSDANKVMVVLGNGGEKTGDAVAAADDARDEGIRVVSIAYGEDADEPLMQSIAGGDGENYYAANSESYLDEVQTVFQEIAGDLCSDDGTTLADFTEEFENGYQLDADPNDGEGDSDAFDGATDYHIGFEWWIPIETGNEIQTDSTEFDLEFYAEQERNNPTPSNPFAVT